MDEPATPTFLAAAAGISVPYASQILGGKRSPARSLAIHIFRKTGWRHSSIEGLTDDQMEMLEVVDPWFPSQGATSAKAA